MGLFDGFPFRSREDLRRQAEDFEQRVLPFGDAQKGMALSVLQRLIKGKKLNDADRLFAFLNAKDAYTKQKEQSDALNSARQELKKQERFMTPEEINLVLALVVLDSALLSLDEYPTEEQVVKLAKET